MKASHRILSILFLLAWALPTACSPTPKNAPPPTTDGGKPGPVEVARSDRPRQAAAPQSAENVAAWAEGNTAFAVDLYHVLSTKTGNLFFSPYSISVALAMTSAGAAGDTASQMANALRFGLPPAQLHPAFNAYEQDLETRAQASSEGTPFELSIANSLWGQEGFEFTPAFLNLLAENYGAGMRLVDFVQDTEGARLAINAWVSDETRGRIEDLIPQGVLDGMTRLVLANAIYFKAGWLYGFNKDLTAPEPFHRLDGTTLEIPMMHQSESFAYLRGTNYQALQLPYQTGDLSMLIVLPDEAQFDDVESALSPGLLQEIAAGISPASADVSLPKFSYDSSFELNAALQALGMADAFDPARADFSGMDGARDLYIGDVLHKAFVAVDEDGTEAAAATAVIMKLTSAMPGEPVLFKADRPFLYLVLDTQTGSVLFLGRVVDPSA
jgi:serpin B